MAIWTELKIVTAQWKVWYQGKGRLARFVLPLFCFGLIVSASCLFLGMPRLGLLLSGNQSVYRNLPLLWNEDPLKVHIIDVGQGDASLIQLGGKNILIDAGPPDHAKALLDYLKALGVKKLDLLILTHPHDDHLGGAPLIMENLEVDHLFIAHDDMSNGLQQQITDLADQKRISYSHPYRGARIQTDDLTMECLHPRPQDYANINNYSSVWLLAFRESRWLFLADLEKDEFASLTLAHTDFVRTGHHGSATSFDGELFQRLGPRLFAISCGLNNSFGHPDKALLNWLKDAQRAFFRTDRNGTRVITTDGKSLRWVH